MNNMKLWPILSHTPAVAFLGMCKNAGKTSALNRLLNEIAESGAHPVGLSSIGRDGETCDLVTGTKKPPIYVREGTLVATAEKLLPLCDVSREILCASGLFTSLGEVIIFRARSDGFVQLAGPGIVEHMTRVRKIMTDLGARFSIIDGALNRLSFLSAVRDGRVVLSTGASLDRDIDTVVAETAYAADILSLPVWERERPEEENIKAVDGAFTGAQAMALLRNSKEKAKKIVLRDPSCLLIRRELYLRLVQAGFSFEVKEGTSLAAITVNGISAGGWSFDADLFREKMQAAVSVPVIDVMRE